VGLLVCLVWLIAALLVADRSDRPWMLGTAAVLAGIAGTTLPDLDLILPLLHHRSALTHSLLPLLLALFTRRWRPVMGGLAIGLGLHLAADTFPNAMRGFATVKLPLSGSIGPGASYAWLGVQAAAATIAGAVLLAATLPVRVVAVVAILLIAMGVAYLFATDGGWWALGVYAAFGWLAARQRPE
jgi:hypothetical protein